MTVCLLMAAYPEINVGVCLEGSPNVVQMLLDNGYDIEEIPSSFKANNLATYPERIDGRPLLFWHAQGDQWVDVKYVQDFYHANKDNSALKYTYYTEDEGGEHFVPYSEVVRMAYFIAYAYQTSKSKIWPLTEQKMTALYGNESFE